MENQENAIKNSFLLKEEDKEKFINHFTMGILQQLHKENLLSDEQLNQGLIIINK